MVVIAMFSTFALYYNPNPRSLSRHTLPTYFTIPYSKEHWLPRAVAIKFGVVRLVVRDATARGVWGHAPPRTYLEFRGYEIASETIFGPKRCFTEA